MKNQTLEELIEEFSKKYVQHNPGNREVPPEDYVTEDAQVMIDFIKKVYEAGQVIEKEYDFGSYCCIEQKRYGVKNQYYEYKIINRLKSNYWVDVPVQVPATETCHKKVEDVVSCICCGVDETEVLKFRIKDIKLKP